MEGPGRGERCDSGEVKGGVEGGGRVNGGVRGDDSGDL